MQIKKLHFENLLRSLFLRELCQEGTILHSDHNHLGVEVAPVLGKDGTGQTILDQAMNFPQVLSCYFGLDSLDDKWFQKNIDLGLANLGRRYNPLFSVDTEAQRNISLFLRELAGIAEVNTKKDNLISELKDLRWRCNRKYKSEIIQFTKWAKSLRDVDVKSFLNALDWKRQLENECSEVFANLRNRLAEAQTGMAKYSYEDPEYKKLREEEFCIERILGVVSCLEFSRTENTMMSCRTAIITGDMGTGKSQLLATAAKRMVNSDLRRWRELCWWF